MKLFTKIYKNKKFSITFTRHLLEGFKIGIEITKTPLVRKPRAWWVFVRLGFHTLMFHYFEGERAGE